MDKSETDEINWFAGLKEYRQAARVAFSSPVVPLVGGLSNQAAVLLLESCRINVVKTEHPWGTGYQLRNGTRGKVLEPNNSLVDAIRLYATRGPVAMINNYGWHLEIAALLCESKSEAPSRNLLSCLEDAMALWDQQLRSSVESLGSCLDLDEEAKIRQREANKVIPFPTPEQK